MIGNDHHFVIGHQHAVCQDYCSSREGFAALSDGCSCVLDANGKPIEAHTDIGARLIVRAAFHHRDQESPEVLVMQSIATANSYRSSLDLSINTLSATLVIIRDAGSHFESIVCGDGLIAARNKIGSWTAISSQYAPIPFYPRYLHEQVDITADLQVTEFQTGSSTSSTHSSTDKIQVRIFPKDQYDCVVGISDGAFSFLKEGTPLWNSYLASRLLDLRRIKGRYVLRNLSGILKELSEERTINQDDISMISLFDDGVR